MADRAGVQRDPGSRRDIVLGQLLEAAEDLFARKGVGGTTLQELAESVGLTRTAVYHYVKNKDELLEYLVADFTLDTARDMQARAAASGEPALDRLRAGVEAMAQKVAEHPARFRLLLTAEDSFSEALGQQYRRARRETLAALTELVRQCVGEGSARPIDPETAAFGLLGVANWIAFWFPRGEGVGAQSPSVVAGQLVDFAVRGLGSASPVDDPSPRGALNRMREEIARVEAALGAS